MKNLWPTVKTRNHQDNYKIWLNLPSTKWLRKEEIPNNYPGEKMAPEITQLALNIVKHTYICIQICKIPFSTTGLIWPRDLQIHCVCIYSEDHLLSSALQNHAKSYFGEGIRVVSHSSSSCYSFYLFKIFSCPVQ